jgi:hypothetical protein
MNYKQSDDQLRTIDAEYSSISLYEKIDADIQSLGLPPNIHAPQYGRFPNLTKGKMFEKGEVRELIRLPRTVMSFSSPRPSPTRISIFARYQDCVKPLAADHAAHRGI